MDKGRQGRSEKLYRRWWGQGKSLDNLPHTFRRRKKIFHFKLTYENNFFYLHCLSSEPRRENKFLRISCTHPTKTWAGVEGGKVESDIDRAVDCCKKSSERLYTNERLIFTKVN